MTSDRLQRLKLRITPLVFISFFAPFSLLEAAVWKNVPALPQAQRIKQEEALVNNVAVQTTIYSTLTTPQEIAEFYKKKLVNFGWKLETETAQQGINLLVFSEKEELLNITVKNISGKNFVTVLQSKKTEESTGSCPECREKLAEIKKDMQVSKEKGKATFEELARKEEDISPEDSSGKDLQFVPRYPGAARINSIEREKGKKVALTYYVQDSVERIENFYRKNMGNYYWELEREVDFQNLPEKLAETLNTSIKGRSLIFKNPSASCIISITEDPQGKGTIIGVNYNEK